METRNIQLTLEKAKEWYNSGNEALKETALQAYTKEELTAKEFEGIKTFEDAYKALGLKVCSVEKDIENLECTLMFASKGMSNHMVAMYKLEIIRKALNKGWKPGLVEGNVYYPYVRFYPASNKTREAASSNGWKLCETFEADGEKYTLVGGDYSDYYCDGLAYFGFGYGGVLPNLGLLGCKSKEVAEHMSRYFAKTIFEACYAHTNTYKWC